MEEYLPALMALLELEEENPRLVFAMEASLAEILRYTGQETLPDGLVHPWLLLTAGRWKAGLLGGGAPLSALSRGDVTWKYDTGAQNNDDGFCGQRRALDAYRKVRWFHG